MSFEGEKAPAEPQVYDLVLVAVGRSPNGKKIDADKAGVIVSDRGFISVDKQMRTNRRTSLRSATSSASRCSRTRQCTKRTSRLKLQRATARSSMHARFRRWRTPIRRSRGPGSPRSSARRRASSTARRCSRGRPRVARSPTAATRASPSSCSTKPTHRCIGGAIVGTHAGDLIGEVCLAVEMGCDPVDIGKTIHPHPTLGRVDRHGRGSVRGRVHRSAAGEEEMTEGHHG